MAAGSAGRPPLRKRLGQHHLRHGGLCRPLVEFLRPHGEWVLEIGPGGGVLTAELLAAGASVVGWELDPAWAAELRRRLPGDALEVVVGDALELAWDRLPAGALVAGNLPYGIATVVVEAVLVQAPQVPRAAFLVQREVARRLVAAPGTPDYGALSVLVALRAEAHLLAAVRAGSFVPPPKVESAFVGLERRPPPLPADRLPALETLIRGAFRHRRKTLRNALSGSWDRATVDRVLDDLGWAPDTRAERLGTADFVALLERGGRYGATIDGQRGKRRHSW